jgi:uncharacterized protein YutE (UPF0331/DUF86 family)
VIAAEGFRKPLQLREIPLILGEKRVIPQDLATTLARAAGLRNRLVHAYADIDHSIIYDVLKKDLGDLEAFAVAIGQLCQEQGRGGQ